ncbi:MAG TPA: DUF456 family protein [Solimonas sp.]|nr:DUF456 family protein [Solimonas sp.]
MDVAMSALLWLAVVGLVGVGLAGAVYPALPGTPLVFIGLWLAAWIEHYEKVGKYTLVLLAVLAAMAVVIDFIASSLGAKRVGASPKAISGATLGTFVGMFFGIPGLLLGPFVGAVLGELAAQRGVQQAARAGIATWLGLLFGTIAKLALSLAMLGIFALFYFV